MLINRKKRGRKQWIHERKLKYEMYKTEKLKIFWIKRKERKKMYRELEKNELIFYVLFVGKEAFISCNQHPVVNFFLSVAVDFTGCSCQLK